MAIPFAYSKGFGNLRFGEGHPFTGDRFERFHDRLEALGLFKDRIEKVDAPLADESVLETVHSREYIDGVKKLEAKSGYVSIDTQVLPGMVDAARLIVGGVMEMAGRLADGRATRAAALGGFHHAGVDYGEGFCIFNDVAIAADWFVRDGGAEKVMIIDTDAHAGNGTSDIFYRRKDVLMLSIHQDPLTIYPGRCFAPDVGEGEGRGFNINIPMPPFSGDIQYNRAFDDIIGPVVREHAPDVIIRNGGSDPYFGDELTNLGLSPDGLVMLGKRARLLADEVGARHLDLTVSGYGDHVIDGWLAIFKGSMGLDHLAHDFGPSGPRWGGMERMQLHNKAMEVMTEVKGYHRNHWKCLA